MTPQAKLLLIYQHIQTNLVCAEKAILNLPLISKVVRHSLESRLSEGLGFGPKINQLLLQKSWQILIPRHFITALKSDLSTVQNHVPQKNTRQSGTLFLKEVDYKMQRGKRKVVVENVWDTSVSLFSYRKTKVC